MGQSPSAEHRQKFPSTADSKDFFAQLKKIRKETEDNLKDDLCRACARYNWRQLIGTFLDKDISSRIRSPLRSYSKEDEQICDRILATIKGFRTHRVERDTVQLGDNWPSSPETCRPLAPLGWTIANRDSCSLCGLISEAAFNQNNDLVAFDRQDFTVFWIAHDDQYTSSIFHISRASVLSQEVGERWQLSFCFYDDGKSPIRAIGEKSFKPFTHPTNWFMNRISPCQIDLNIIKCWMRDCETKHWVCKDLRKATVLDDGSLHYPMEENKGLLPNDQSRQHTIKDKAQLFTLRLIDVLKDEVIQSSGRENYYSLSYVWGTATQYKALSRNFRNSVLHLNRSVLPQTIQDAMGLVQSLGERYLWVDVLCIIQDDPDEVTSTLRFMNKIYSDATMTIVAADGSADHGLRGVRPNSRDLRKASSCVDTIPFMEETHILDMSITAWAQRGWTFQEGISAKKWLIFSNSRVFFACLDCVVGEDQPVDPIEVDKASRQDYEISYQIDQPQSLWVDYRTKVLLYTTRHLSYEDDVIDAFSGLMERYQELSGSLFSSCLPTNTDSLFTIALLWRPLQSLVRRVSPVRRQGRDVFFPSWSWIGWKGPVRWGSPGDHYDDLMSLNCAISWPWGQPNMADWRKRADEEGVLEFDAEVAMLSLADMEMIDAVHLDNGTVWKRGRRKCVALATILHTVFLIVVKHRIDGTYSRKGVCEINDKLWSQVTKTKEHLFLV